jgi:hypothetical protein
MMQIILYRQKRQVRSGLGRQLQAAILGLSLMAAWSRIISEKVIVCEIVEKTPTIWNPKLILRVQDTALYPVLIQINSFHTITAHFLFIFLILRTRLRQNIRVNTFLSDILHKFLPTSHPFHASIPPISCPWFNIAVHIRQDILVSLLYWLCKVIGTSGLYNCYFVVAKSRVQILGQRLATFTGCPWFSWLPPGKYRIIYKN